ncbi:MAG: thiamine diphosphokinase [Chloroflexi bacterium]|nr:thiamine diphosphokinase [Chloroflexota bacterium]
MTRAVIVANAPGIDWPTLAALLPGALVVAADGGARAFIGRERGPDVIIGDGDSLAPAELAQLAANGARIVPHPRDKDETDLELALAWALAHGAEECDIVGALGGRWDHSLANVLVCAGKRFAACRMRLHAPGETLYIVHTSVVLDESRGATVSLIPLTAVVTGVTTRGLRYELSAATLRHDQGRGLSNVLLVPPAMVTLESGVLLVCLHHDDGAHQWRNPLPHVAALPEQPHDGRDRAAGSPH